MTSSSTRHHIDAEATASAPRSAAALNVVLFDQTGLSRQLRIARDLLLGSDRRCDLTFDAPVAARHVEIYRVGDLWWVRDLDTAAGTYLNGEAIEVAPLEGPAHLELGRGGPRLALYPDV